MRQQSLERAGTLESLSVIVTAHNCANLIRRTLESVAAAVAFLRRDTGHTAAAVEIVVVDDGSSDQTSQVVTEFGNGRSGWLLVRRERCSSPSCARNTGVGHAQGDILF